MVSWTRIRYRYVLIDIQLSTKRVNALTNELLEAIFLQSDIHRYKRHCFTPVVPPLVG